MTRTKREHFGRTGLVFDRGGMENAIPSGASPGAPQPVDVGLTALDVLFMFSMFSRPGGKHGLRSFPG
jgi:hypothetical protein